MAKRNALNILLVDDHELVRLGMRRLLEAHPLVHTIVEADSGEQALQRVAEQPVDIVMMDLSLPGMSGLKASERLLKRCPELAIIMVTGRLEGSLTRRLADCGVQGYITKGANTDELDSAIRSVIQGKRYLSADVARHMADEALAGAGADPFDRLTARELEIIEALLDGQRNRQIAEALHISEKTVSTHRTRAYEKLAVATTAELVRLAIRCGRWRDD